MAKKVSPIKNPNYVVQGDGFVRAEGVPDVVSTNRQNWLDRKIQIVQDSRQAVADLRQKQNERNQAHKDKHADG